MLNWALPIGACFKQEKRIQSDGSKRAFPNVTNVTLEQETRLGLDGRKTTVTFVTVNPEQESTVDPFDEWFTNHVINDDV